MIDGLICDLYKKFITIKLTYIFVNDIPYNWPAKFDFIYLDYDLCKLLNIPINYFSPTRYYNLNGGIYSDMSDEQLIKICEEFIIIKARNNK